MARLAAPRFHKKMDAFEAPHLSSPRAKNWCGAYFAGGGVVWEGLFRRSFSIAVLFL